MFAITLLHPILCYVPIVCNGTKFSYFAHSISSYLQEWYYLWNALEFCYKLLSSRSGVARIVRQQGREMGQDTYDFKDTGKNLSKRVSHYLFPEGSIPILGRFNYQNEHISRAMRYWPFHANTYDRFTYKKVKSRKNFVAFQCRSLPATANYDTG